MRVSQHWPPHLARHCPQKATLAIAVRCSSAQPLGSFPPASITDASGSPGLASPLLLSPVGTMMQIVDRTRYISEMRRLEEQLNAAHRLGDPSAIRTILAREA